MMGSQANLGRANDGPQLPGLENLGDDAMIAGGLEQDSDIPAGMEFVPSSVPDGSFEFNVASTGTGKSLAALIKSKMKHYLTDTFCNIFLQGMF